MADVPNNPDDAFAAGRLQGLMLGVGGAILSAIVTVAILAHRSAVACL